MVEKKLGKGKSQTKNKMTSNCVERTGVERVSKSRSSSRNRSYTKNSSSCRYDQRKEIR